MCKITPVVQAAAPNQKKTGCSNLRQRRSECAVPSCILAPRYTYGPILSMQNKASVGGESTVASQRYATGAGISRPFIATAGATHRCPPAARSPAGRDLALTDSTPDGTFTPDGYLVVGSGPLSLRRAFKFRLNQAPRVLQGGLRPL